MIPVILIHFGECAHLPLAVAQAKQWGNTTVVLGDAARADSADAHRFAEHYAHMSTNHYAFERMCFERWFVLRDWMRATNIDVVFYQDSDVLLYCNVNDQWVTWGKGYDLTLALGTSPATSYFTRAGIEAFCDFVLDTYIHRGALYPELERIYREMRAQNLPGGISDMALFRFFKAQVTHMRVGEMTDIRNGWTWDHNINASDGFQMKDGHKDIAMLRLNANVRSGIPFPLPYGIHDTILQGLVEVKGFGLVPAAPDARYTQGVGFNALHFQGGAKRWMPQYATKTAEATV